MQALHRTSHFHAVFQFSMSYIGVSFSVIGIIVDMTHSQMLGKVESGGGPIFKVVLEF